jgi:pimeloyl-ACP methyl ester carboxylesterase
MTLAQKVALAFIKTKFQLISAFSQKRAAQKAFDLFCTPMRRKQFKKIPAVFQKAEKLHFKEDGHTIRGYRWNKGGDKRVLIVHGFESRAYNFEHYISPLIRNNIEVLAFDAPAHGDSGSKKINALYYRNCLLRINQLYGKLDGIVAHSLGGLATALFVDVVDKGNYDRIALVAPATKSSSAVDSFFKVLQLPPTLRPHFEAIIQQLTQQPVSWFSVDRVLKHNKTANVLWIHDADDEVCPFADLAAIQAAAPPNIQFVITQGLGHKRIYKDNKVRKQIIDFMRWNDAESLTK